jgi:hypothetical protein
LCRWVQSPSPPSGMLKNFRIRFVRAIGIED